MLVARGGGGVGGGNGGHVPSPPTLAEETEESRLSRSKSSPKLSLPGALPSLATVDVSGSSKSRGRSRRGPSVHPGGCLRSPRLVVAGPTNAPGRVAGAGDDDSDHQGAEEDGMLTSVARLESSAPPTRRSTLPRPLPRSFAPVATPDATATAAGAAAVCRGTMTA